MSRRPLFTEIRRTERANELRHEAVVGIVTDNQDPQKLGRIKVKLPAISDDATHWAPIASLGAGKDRGWWFLPEIDDEVLIMFAHGDLSRPVVVGALWNGTDKPPEQNGGSNERRMLVSRSGHKVIFDDDAGTITFEDGGGVGKVVIGADKIEVEAKQGDFASQSPQGQTNIIANDVELKGSQGVNIKAGTDLKISGRQVTIDGGAKLDIVGVKVDINPGGVGEASEAEGECESVPDPVGD
jgi:phage baseplate assembly protein V